MQCIPGYVLCLLKGSKGIGIPNPGFCPRIMDDSKTKYSGQKDVFWLKNACLGTYVKHLKNVSETIRNKPPGLISFSNCRATTQLPGSLEGGMCKASTSPFAH